jgi:cell shape-determining protein MreC
MQTGNLGAEPVVEASGAMVLDNKLQGTESQDTTLQSAELPDLDENSMTWPMLPGENLNDVARLFYPQNQYMQTQFVFKTLHLSKHVQPNLNPKKRFKEPTLLVIPTLKSLSNSTHAIKSGPRKLKNQTLNMSYHIERIPETLVKEYESLVTKNEFLKKELAKLNEKLIFLQAKLTDLKLTLDKTLGGSNVKFPDKASPVVESSTKKVFKNLDVKANQVKADAQEESGLRGWFDNSKLFLVLGLGVLLGLCAYILKKYRQSVDSKLNFVASRMQETVGDLNGYWQTTKLATVQESEAKTTQQAQAAKASKDAETRVDSALEEAKLLMSINRTSDAISHLKMTIESQPKSSINHWLYLLDVFKKLKLKEDFENYARELHTTFNVLPPIWQDTEIPMVVPKSLQEFPHIMEKLFKIWPEDSAYVYLRGLIVDNRGGERSGFGTEVVEEILMLIALLDTRKELS